MARGSRRPALNRPVFTQNVFDSRALTVLTTLMHRFPEPGTFEAFVRRDGRLVGRLAIDILRECAERQINVNLAKLEVAEGTGGCRGARRYELSVDGLLGFYVSRGSGRYRVTVTTSDEKEEAKRTVLDNSRCVPEGDLFAVTLVRPGVYHLVESRWKSETEIRVRLPEDVEDYRPDTPRLFELDEEGVVEKGPIELYSGQSVVLRCMEEASIEVRLEEPDESVGEPVGKPPPAQHEAPKQRPDEHR